MKKLLIAIFLVFLSSLTLAQDIVYDSIQGNRNYWLRIKGGQKEQITLSLMYENFGILSKSKVLSAAGLLDGMEYGKDYLDYSFLYDTLTYEIKTKDPINLLVYRYYYNDTTFYYFAGLRKAEFGSPTLDGQYFFITPLVAQEAEIKIYDGIGPDRNQILNIFPPALSENFLREYILSNQVTIQGIKVSNILRSSKTEDFITDIEETFADKVKIWPNPTSNILHIEMENLEGVIIRIFDIRPLMLYHQQVFSNYHFIDFSHYSSGTFLLVITNKLGIVLYTVKIVKI